MRAPTACIGLPPASRPSRALTLVECMLAVLVLSITVAGIAMATVPGHQHLAHADTRVRAVRLAEHLVEEIGSRRYAGSGGADRSSWHLDDYVGFEESPGTLRDALGALYPAEDQAFTRAVSISPQSYAMAELDDVVIAGRHITVTVRDATGAEWALSRFVPEPMSP